MAELEFFGAAQTVTGSMHILHVASGAFALDCGLYQGRRQEARQRNETFPLDPGELRGVMLSHAHIDHSGNIPGLVKRGFHGPIYATAATADLCKVMLIDSAKIQEEDARFWNEKRARVPSERIRPLYTIEDAKASEGLFRPKGYNAPFEFAPGARATFLEAGHILGSACILVEIEQSPPVRLLYTGDLGRHHMPILRDPAHMPPVDYLITESTYADRHHANPTDMKEQLAWIIRQTQAAGGKTIIPAFSVGRTQNIVYYLTRAIEEKLMEPLPIYVDSPLSVNATEVFRRHPEVYDAEASKFHREHNGDIFGGGLVTYITDVEASKRLNSLEEPCVIIASSGMCEAGRVLHHLKNNIEDERNTVVIAGYQAQHTLGRRIVERREEIRIFGRLYKLLCRVEVLNGFSAHADADDMVEMLAPLAKRLKAAFCVHGEGPQPAAMKKILETAGCRDVFIPAIGQRYPLV